MPGSSSPTVPVVLVVVLVTGAVCGLLLLKRPGAASVRSSEPPVLAQNPSNVPEVDPGHPRAHPVVPEDPTRLGPNAAQAPFSELAAGLTNLDLSAGRLSPEQAAQVRESFRSLAAQGDAAV
ncbi:MAG TPA: hypothetical protein VHI52_08815, partial [Verrucomicrobiae bacterium]|nr:hypothetical protein [Verrucomicrobiae bacterium]